jgi:signal transduction histidine kinase
LWQLLRAADYAERADISDAPPCLLYIDRLRLSQVFDNIFNNSYKYAGTAMKVQYDFSGDYLAVKIVDFGPGVPEEILPLISNKFYRGENAQGISGSGLGLYLARYFIEQMGGGFCYENHVENGIRCGFAVRVELPLAGRGGV